MPQLFVKSINGNTRTIEAEQTDTISTIKERIFDKEGIQPNEQRLIFAGKSLDNEKTIGEYNIEPESTIHMSLRVRGGSKCGSCWNDLSILASMNKEPIPWNITSISGPEFCCMQCYINYYNLQKVNYIAKIRYKSIKYHFIDSKWELFDETVANAMSLDELVTLWKTLKPLDQNSKWKMRGIFDDLYLVMRCPEDKPNYRK